MKNDNIKNKTLLIIGIITTILLLTLGITYAAFSYMQTGEDNHEVVLGDIYMHYGEKNQLLLENAMPSSFKLNTLKLPSVTTGYTVNPVMKEQTVKETNELTRCVVYYSSLDFIEGSDAESFCKGEGRVHYITPLGVSTVSNLQQGISEWQGKGVNNFLTTGGQTLVDMGIVIQEGENYVVNPVMQTQNVLDINELTRCSIIYQETTLEEGVSVVDFCQGNTSGVVTNIVASGEVGDIESTTSTAKTLQGLINEKSSSETFLTKGGQYLLDLGIIKDEGYPDIKYSYTSLKVNPDMEGEVLESCKTIFTDLGYEFEEGKSVEDFCQGTGISSGKSINDLATDTDFLKGEGHQLLRSGVVLAKIENLPYFEFTISGKNTYSKKDIYYDIVLSHGDDHGTKTERIRDDLLRFSLTEVDSKGNEIPLANNISLTNLKNGERVYVETIPKNTMEEINKTYRLYMNIAGSTKICGGEVNRNCDYYTDAGKSPNWNDVFASVKVNVTGDFNEKNYRYFVHNFKDAVESKSGTSVTDTDGTIYLSGESDVINYNYVSYSGMLWRITAIYPDGTMKLVSQDSTTSMQWGGEDGKFINSSVYTYLNNHLLYRLDNYQNVIVTDYNWDTAYLVTSLEIGDTDYVSAPVGLLNSYEYYMSYKNTKNYVNCKANNPSNPGCYASSGYLVSDYYWWLLNNKKILGNDLYGSGAKVIAFSGSVYYSKHDPFKILDNSAVRPSIVLKSNVLVSYGDGSYDNPYVINTGNN